MKLFAAFAFSAFAWPVLAAIDKPEDYAEAFATAVRERADGMFVGNIQMNRAHALRIVALAAKHRLPAEYFFRESVEAGGLVAYGVDLLDLARRCLDTWTRSSAARSPATGPSSCRPSSSSRST